MTQVNYLYHFVINTKEYSGNFERPLCAYITGRTGDCGVGKEERIIFEKEIPGYPFDDFVVNIPDEHGCSRPVSIDGVDKNWETHIHFRDRPSIEDISFLKERAYKFQEYWKTAKYGRDIGILGFSILIEKTEYIIEDLGK